MATEFQQASSEYDLASSIARLEARGAAAGRRSGIAAARAAVRSLMVREKDETRWYAFKEAAEALDGLL